MEKKVMELINCLSNARKLIDELNGEETMICGARIDYDENGKMDDPKIHFAQDLPEELFSYNKEHDDQYIRKVAHVGDVELFHLVEKEAGENASLAV